MSQRLNVGSSERPHTGPSFHQFANAPNPARAIESDGVWKQIQSRSQQAEDVLDNLSQPIRPYLPALGRFLIVVTFFEDALRILTQWSDQIWCKSLGLRSSSHAD